MSIDRRYGAGVVVMLAALAWGCGPEAEMEDGVPAEDVPTGQQAAAGPARAMPDTTAEAVWSFLQEEAYREDWRLWPGKGELYTGQEPHGMLLTTYANDVAYQALMAGNVADLPEDAVIVKENWSPDSTFMAATVMMKEPGYNPEHQDWLFAKYQPDGTVDAFGRADGCQSCHGGASDNGYIFTEVQR